MFKIDSETEKLISNWLDKMTLKQKIGQLVQSGKFRGKEKEMVRHGKIGSLLNFCGSTAVTDLQKSIMSSECKIPLLIGDDVIHGYKTGFPIPLAESCSFNLDLMEEAAAIAAREASCDGVNLIFAPMVDISRDPRWGRVAEGAGEDVFYGSKVAKARVEGFMRNDWDDRPHVTACPKHFIGYGASEGGRDYCYTEISEYSLRDTYIPPFQAAVDAGAGVIMSSFNDVSGKPASLSKHLLTDVLRGEMGFQGMVLSDWESAQHGKSHGVAADDYEATKISICAGLDMDMNSEIYLEQLEKLVENGDITEAQINEAVKRVLRVKYSLGLFDNYESPQQISEKIFRNKGHIETAYKIAKESIVLLKNENNILPLSKDDSIVVIGPLADSKADMLGCWQCKTNADNVITVLQGIREKSSQSNIIYKKGCPTGSHYDTEQENEAEWDEAIEAAKNSSVVVMVLGETCGMSGENNSRAFLGIPAPQKKLLQEIYKVNKNIVLVLINGRPLTIAWENENIPAIVEAWQLGDECGHAVADVLFGDYNPSGKLTISFPRSVGQIPVYYNQRNSGRPELVRYIDEDIAPLYPFGYGLSYSKFVYESIEFSSNTIKIGEQLDVFVTLYNDSNITGHEVVQIYLQDLVASVTRPVKSFCGFKKTEFSAGERKTVKITIEPEQFSFVGEDLKIRTETGTFRIYAGTNSNCSLCKDIELI